ncbi:cell division [Paramecium bursaria]
MEEYNFNDSTQTITWSETKQSQTKPLFILELPKLRDPISPYIEEIFENFRDQENKFLVQSYLPMQLNINYNQMTQLIDWVIDTIQQLNYKDETLYLTLNIIGRYLNIKQINLDNLQLLAICSINIAAKYEEKNVRQIKLSKLKFDYTNQQIAYFEGDILIAINFQLTIPYPQQFVWYYGHQLFSCKEQVAATEYIIEISYFSLHNISASLLGLSAVYLVLKYCCIPNPWYYLSSLEKVYSLELVEQVTDMLDKLLQNHFQEEHHTNLKQKFFNLKNLQFVSGFHKYYQAEFIQKQKLDPNLVC